MMKIADSKKTLPEKLTGILNPMQTMTPAKRPAILLAPLMAALALSACSTFRADPEYRPFSTGENNPVFDEKLDKNIIHPAPRQLATLIFYRPGRATGKDAPLNVYINGRYLSSLLPGGYVEHNFCAGPMQMAAVFDDARIRHLGQRGKESTISLEAGKTYYVEAETTGTAGAEQAQLITSPTKDVFLGQYRRQSHVLTRAPNCAAVAAVPAPVAAVAVAAAPVTAVVMPVKPVAASTMPEAGQVLAPLESWRAAWERGDYVAYTNFYAPTFKGTLPSRQAWEQQRRARLNNQAKKITVESLAVKATADTIVTDFYQSYVSKQFVDNGQKRLVWQPVNGELKIVEEVFVSKK